MEHALRVAAYCRVSTDKEDQLHSLAAQQAYFEGYIARHGWRCAGIFADGSSIVGLSQKELEKQAFFDLVQPFFPFYYTYKREDVEYGQSDCRYKF